MGFEDGVEQSFGRPYRQSNGRTKQTCELTSSIVPRGTSSHRSVELEFSPIGFDPSLIGRLGSSAFAYPPLQCRCRSRARASLRNRHQGPSIMGFEDGVEQSLARPYRQSDGRVQADMRSHLIHRPARDIIPPLGGARVSSYRIWSCAVFMLLPRRLVPGSSGTRCRQPICGA